jgi:hypothetical protein
MEFGILKSKIEKKLTESYSKNSFNKEIKTFRDVVLKNDGISRAYHIYNEISKSKGFDKKFAEDYVNECIDIFNRIKFSKKSISLLESWVSGTKCENQYKDIDTIFNKSTLVIENIIESKNKIISNLTTKESTTELINIPLEKIVEVANENLKNYLTDLNESELNQVKKYLTLPKNEISKRYEVLSELVIEKLENMLNESDVETKERISETISKIKNDTIDSISLIKLKTLNENL